jgi:hypothetical protein
MHQKPVGTARQELRRFVIGKGERTEAMANQNTAVLVNPKKRMCAHIPCLCIVPDGEEYCGAACRGAGSEDVEIACQCDHAACPLTIRSFVARSADLTSL